MKSLALFTTKKSSVNYFNKLILFSNIISEELDVWLQSYLAVNGPLIRIYTNLDPAKQYQEDNEDALRKFMSPTRSLRGYYQTRKKDSLFTLTPFRVYVHGKQCCITIDFVKTTWGFSCSPPKINP